MKSYKVFLYNSKSGLLESVYANGQFKITTTPFNKAKVLPDTTLVQLGQGPLSFTSLKDALKFRLESKLSTNDDLHVWECEFECDELLPTPKYFMGSFGRHSSIDTFILRKDALFSDSYPAGTICTKQLTLVKRLV